MARKRVTIKFGFIPTLLIFAALVMFLFGVLPIIPNFSYAESLVITFILMLVMRHRVRKARKKVA